MSRRTLAVLLAGAVAACAPARGPAPGPGAAPRLADEPLIRVGLVVDRDSAGFSADGQFRVLTADGDIIAVQDAGSMWRVEPDDGGQLRLSRPDRPEPVRIAAPVVVQPEQSSDYVVVNGRSYRGALLLQRGSLGITVVNRVALEAYLRSVVSLELGFRAPSDRQAVMAQAVAARTYAVRYRGRREALGFDVFPTDADQAYAGVAAEKPEVDEAVAGTVGQVLTWGGTPIEALFHSTCGWSTEASEQVFQNGAPVPYLRAVSDRYGDGDRDFYCAISPRFRWREEWDGAAFAATIGRAWSGGATGRVSDVTVSGTTPTGRVREIVVTTAGGGRYVIPRWRVREVLRPTPDRQLPSTLLQLHVDREDGAVTRVVAAGAGFGHGVGMCQFGAVGRSRAGWDYRAILDTYYHGTRLERVY